jgi:acyl carrier protein
MFQELLQIFKQILPNSKLDFRTINEDSKLFNDICPNSSALVMVAYAIENKYHIDLPGYLEIRKATVGELIKIIKNELNKQKHD